MPVTLADIRARVLDDLKRRDVTTAQLDRWITDAVRRIQRVLTTPMDEAISVAIVPENFSGSITIPGNLLTPISISADGVVLTERSLTDVKRAQKRSGANGATMYARQAGQYLIAPLPPVGTEIEVYYRADFNNVSAPTDRLKLFDIAPELVVAGSLLQASIWAKDDKAAVTWNSVFTSLITELQDLADRQNFSHAAIRPAYNVNGDWNP